MPNHWKTYKLEEAVEKIIDYRGKTPQKAAKGIPLITAKVIKDGRINTPEEFIAEEKYAEWMTRGIPQFGDVVLTTEAPLGEVAQIKTEEKVALAQRVITLRGKQDLIDNTFLKYFLQSPVGQGNLKAKETGTTVTGIKQSELRQVEIYAPDFTQQRRIAAVLSALDEKIELNQQMNATLELIAQAIFKCWFVDFHFPDFNGEFVDDFPTGWRMGKLRDLVSLSKDSINPFDYPDEEFSHYSIPAFDNGKFPVRELGKSILSNKFLVKANSILVSKLNPRFPRIWQVGKIDETNSVCSTEFLVIQPKQSVYFSYCNCFLNQARTLDTLKGLASGTSGSHQRIKPEDILNLSMIVPDEAIIEKFGILVRQLFERVNEVIYENYTLTQLRDTLLPKLMSGKIRVAE
jgi:type I restriction enzyme S subunit